MKRTNEKGITLIALVLTIIVLLILATISIGAMTGEGGIVENAKYSAFASKIRQYEENVNTYIIDEEKKRK